MWCQCSPVSPTSPGLGDGSASSSVKAVETGGVGFGSRDTSGCLRRSVSPASRCTDSVSRQSSQHLRGSYRLLLLSLFLFHLIPGLLIRGHAAFPLSVFGLLFGNIRAAADATAITQMADSFMIVVV